MTGADLLLVLVLLASTIMGLLRGFVREAASLVCWVVATWAAWKLGPLAEPHVRGALLVGLVIMGGELLHLNHEVWWNRSKLVPYVDAVGDWLRAMVGEKGE